MPLISVAIPSYNSAECLNELCARLKASLEKISDDFEIIIVDDASNDRSWELIAELSRKDGRLKGIRLSRNFGQHHAITAGLDRATGDWVVVMDCDLQDAPEDIARLYKKAKEGYDIVLAKREARNTTPLKHLLSVLFYKVFNYLADTKLHPNGGNFRIISKRVCQQLRLMREQLRFFVGMVDWIGFPVAQIEVGHNERAAGNSTYTFRKLVSLSASAVIAYSNKPLALSIKFGFAMAFAAFLFGIYFMLRVLIYGTPITGWSSIIVSLYFIGGIIIMFLGIHGVYLGRIFNESKGRPLYIIMDYAGFKDDPAGRPLSQPVS